MIHRKNTFVSLTTTGIGVSACAIRALSGHTCAEDIDVKDGAPRSRVCSMTLESVEGDIPL